MRKTEEKRQLPRPVVCVPLLVQLPVAIPKTDDEKAKHKKQFWTVLDEVLWDIADKIPGLRPIITYLFDEGKFVRHGWPSLVLLAGLVGGLVWWLTSEH